MTMTEETQQSETAAQNEAQTSSPDVGKVKDSKKEKCRPMTKVVIRRLPPTMTQEQFLEQVSPLPENDYLYFVKADMSMGQYAFARAYINFVEQQDIFMFREKFDNYVFIDSKGTEYPAVVEFAPFQRLPKKRTGKKKDLKCGTIESDPYYISFLETRKNQEAESNISQPKTEYSYQPPDNTPKKLQPLLFWNM
uniref:Regulator of nonsense transcripts 3B n=1 Tax=Apis cerana TaxID=7461 RepID=V9IBD9_APICE